METAELLKKVRLIEIKTKGLSNQIFSGEYHSAFKGRGMAFSEVREYIPGDEIRTIDWNVTARFDQPYVKVFEEERELTMMLLVDVSASEAFGTRQKLKRELITEICAVLAFSAIQNNDKVGVIFFSDQVEKFIPPKKGRSHILRIIRELLDFKPDHSQTNIAEALGYFNQVIKKRSITFLISDFQDQNFEKAMRIAARKHDLVGIKVYDQAEMKLPDVGFVPLKDPETGVEQWIDTSSKQVRLHYESKALERDDVLKNMFKKSGIDFTSIRTDRPYTQPLMHLFQRREARK
ncbi:MAG: DUF58 domain-containing protein [Crocinitomicaceae bacterium]|nr:DUF58 domain-containing protein [Crocinitomicaceae bacterium]